MSPNSHTQKKDKASTCKLRLIFEALVQLYFLGKQEKPGASFQPLNLQKGKARVCHTPLTFTFDFNPIINKFQMKTYLIKGKDI